jgi:hypothetical protein
VSADPNVGDPNNPRDVQTKDICILIACPAYGGLTHASHNEALRGLEQVFGKYGIRYSVLPILTESLIPRARNAYANIVAFDKIKQLTPDGMGGFREDMVHYTHLLFLDVDIGFNPQNIIEMIRMNQDIVGLPYACKDISWGKIVEAVKRGETDPVRLSRMGHRPIINTNGTAQSFNPSQPSQFPQIGTGVLLIKRGVFLAMAEDDKLSNMTVKEFEQSEFCKSELGGSAPWLEFAKEYAAFLQQHPRRRYKLMAGEMKFGDRDFAYDFFSIGVNPETSYYDSEDYRFCHDAAKLGFKIWFLPWAVTSHTGNYSFIMDIPIQTAIGLQIGPEPSPDTKPIGGVEAQAVAIQGSGISAPTGLLSPQETNPVATGSPAVS